MKHICAFTTIQNPTTINDDWTGVVCDEPLFCTLMYNKFLSNLDESDHALLCVSVQKINEKTLFQGKQHNQTFKHKVRVDSAQSPPIALSSKDLDAKSETLLILCS